MLLRLLLFALTFFPLATRACDLCGCYTPQLESMPKEKVSLTGFYTAIAEQFTYFGSLQFDDREVANPTGQRLESSITQFVVGYGINDRLALQFNAPLIYRDFRRPERFSIDEGTVSGIGDVSLLARPSFGTSHRARAANLMSKGRIRSQSSTSRIAPAQSSRWRG
jgi:hypothetical protein